MADVVATRRQISVRPPVALAVPEEPDWDEPGYDPDDPAADALGDPDDALLEVFGTLDPYGPDDDDA